MKHEIVEFEAPKELGLNYKLRAVLINGKPWFVGADIGGIFDVSGGTINIIAKT
jgi:prophage antirepressor-like protein